MAGKKIIDLNAPALYIQAKPSIVVDYDVKLYVLFSHFLHHM